MRTNVYKSWIGGLIKKLYSVQYNEKTGWWGLPKGRVIGIFGLQNITRDSGKS